MSYTDPQKRRDYYKRRRDAFPGIVLGENDLVRFRSKLERDLQTGCLNFTGFKNSGYGQFHLHDRMVKAHRIAWVIAGNEITDDKPHILHKCDNPSCCEVSHLWAGNDADNHADRARKNRSAKSRTGLPFGVQLRGNRYRARVHVNGKTVNCGTFDSIEEAAMAALAARDPRHR